MSMHTVYGSTLGIGPVRVAATDTPAEFAALTYADLGQVGEISELNLTREDVTYQTLQSLMPLRGKGTYTPPTITVTGAWDQLDAGLIAIRAAALTSFEYAFKMGVNDAIDANDTPSIFYFHGLVFGVNRQQGGANAPVLFVATIGITTVPAETPRAVVS